MWYKWYWHNKCLEQYDTSNKLHINPARSQPYPNPKYIFCNAVWNTVLYWNALWRHPTVLSSNLSVHSLKTLRLSELQRVCIRIFVTEDSALISKRSSGLQNLVRGMEHVHTYLRWPGENGSNFCFKWLICVRPFPLFSSILNNWKERFTIALG